MVCRKLGISREAFHQNYEAIGKAMIIREEDEFGSERESYGHLILSSFKLWSVYRYTGIRGPHRTPSVEMISGIHTEVVQTEEGILYLMDPERVMFSKGNKRERHLLSEEVDGDETVLDMFAGIGYFSIPLSFRVKRVYSCEINPDSFHYLVMNKKLNGVDNLVPMLGDSSKLQMKDFADRIIMGHFDSHLHLKKALTYLRNGGKIHLHQLVERGRYESVARMYRKLDHIRRVRVRKVKSYSPSHDHVILDLDAVKN